MKMGVYLPEALTISETEHLMMYQAIARSDAENAELIMEKHIEGVKIRHIRKLESIDNSQIKMK
jgi:DNA-binding GntR family transcriptional regulator